MSHTFAREELDGTIKAYDVYGLWKASENLEVFNIDLTTVLSRINNMVNGFTPDDWQRVMEADLSYPIIVNDITGVLDGCHRSVKAMMLGYTTIRAVRLNHMPPPTRVWNSWDEYRANP